MPLQFQRKVITNIEGCLYLSQYSYHCYHCDKCGMIIEVDEETEETQKGIPMKSSPEKFL
jgi:Fe2+ or Zn2+ uptake regulation protein